jgi:hypothetical protein
MFAFFFADPKNKEVEKGVTVPTVYTELVIFESAVGRRRDSFDRLIMTL